MPRVSRHLSHSDEDHLDGPDLASLILEASPDIVYIYDRVEGRYLFVSGRITAILGYQPEQFKGSTGRQIEQLIHPEDLQHVRTHYAKQSVLGDEDISTTTYRVAHAEGGYRILRCRQKVFFRTPNLEVRLVLGVATDITQEVRRDIELSGLRQDLLHVREDERHRIALELHDTVVQDIMGAWLLLQSLESTSLKDSPTNRSIELARASLASALRSVLKPLIA